MGLGEQGPERKRLLSRRSTARYWATWHAAVFAFRYGELYQDYPFRCRESEKIDAYQAEAGARSSADVLQTGDGLAGTRWVARVAGDCSLRQ